MDNEADIKYDILVTVQIPPDMYNVSPYKFIHIKLDLEMQQKFYPGYVLSKRGMYYASRMVSDQLATITKYTNYDNLVPIYSIWITLTDSGCLANKVLKYQLRNTSCGSINRTAEPVVRMDAITEMFNIIFICIDKNVLINGTVEDGLESIVEFLSLMFTGHFDDRRFQENHDIMFDSVVKRYKKEMDAMAEYLTELEREKAESASIGMKQGMKQGIILGSIDILFEMNWDTNEVFNKIKEKYNLTSEETDEYLNLYFEENGQV